MEDLQKLSRVIFEEWPICDRESFWGPNIFLSLYLPESYQCNMFLHHCEKPHSAELHCLCQVNINSSFNIEIDELTVYLSCSTLF